MSLMEIVELLRNRMPKVSQNASTKVLPDWAVRFLALFNSQAKAIVSLVGINRNASNEKAKTILGWEPRTNEEAIIATSQRPIKFGFIKDFTHDWVNRF